MTLGQKAVDMIEKLPDEKAIQVIQYAEFLAFHTKSESQIRGEDANEDGYIRKPGVLKKKMVMADDFNDTPECFRGYM